MELDDLEFLYLLRMRAAWSQRFRGHSFRLMQQPLSEHEAFDPNGALPIIVAKALRTLDLVHPKSGLCRDLFPLRIEPTDAEESVTGFVVRLVRRETPNGIEFCPPSLGLLHVDFAIEETIKMSMTPHVINLDMLLDDFDDLAAKLILGKPHPVESPVPPVQTTGVDTNDIQPTDELPLEPSQGRRPPILFETDPLSAAVLDVPGAQPPPRTQASRH